MSSDSPLPKEVQDRIEQLEWQVQHYQKELGWARLWFFVLLLGVIVAFGVA